MKREQITAEKHIKIVFRRTGNIFLDSGIVALDYYLEKYRSGAKIRYEFNLSDYELYIESEELFELLENLYYLMGKDIYDTSGEKAKREMGKFYFFKEPFQAIKFSKMKTYGFAGLITNDATPKRSKFGDKCKFEVLYDKDPDFALKIAEYLYANGRKLKYFDFIDGELVPKPEIHGKRVENKGGDSEIFINAGYTKVPELPMDSKYFREGNKTCYWTGENFQKLVGIVNTSAFFAKGVNFNSNLSRQDKKISWKAMYISRFSPFLSMYSYVDGLDSLVVYFLQSDNLNHIKKVFNNNRNIYKNNLERMKCNYTSNFNLYNWGKEKKTDLYLEQYEVLFMLIYSMYKQFLETNQINIEVDEKGWNLFKGSDFENVPISLITFKSDKMGKTLLTTSFEEVDNFKLIIRMILFLEKNDVDFRNLLLSLIFRKPSVNNSLKKRRLERSIRNAILYKVINMKSVLEDFENLFFKCFKQLLIREDMGYKDFNELFKFVTSYESFLNKGGRKNMNQELQNKAVDLGKSIGQGILRFENPGSKKDIEKKNARNGRGNIISLKKARNLQQFLDEIIRLQTKYQISISNDILKEVNQQNFVFIKQFAIIGALNQINMVLRPTKRESNNDETK